MDRPGGSWLHEGATRREGCSSGHRNGGLDQQQQTETPQLSAHGAAPDPLSPFLRNTTTVVSIYGKGGLCSARAAVIVQAEDAAGGSVLLCFHEELLPGWSGGKEREEVQCKPHL